MFLRCNTDFCWSESKIEAFQIEALRLEGYEQTLGIMDSAIREWYFDQHESTLLTAVRQNTDPSRSASQKRISSLLQALTHKPIFKGKEKPSWICRKTSAFLRFMAEISSFEKAQDLSQCHQKFLICEDIKNSISKNSFSDHTLTPVLANSLGLNEGATDTAFLIECIRVLKYSYVCQEWMEKEKRMHFNLVLLDRQDKIAKQINHLTKMREIIRCLEERIDLEVKTGAVSRFLDKLRPELTSEPAKNECM